MSYGYPCCKMVYSKVFAKSQLYRSRQAVWDTAG